MKSNFLFEGLRNGDLADMIYPEFSIDQFKSKMGEDSEIVVLAFKVKEKMAAIDTMEFIEKGYKFVLDADMSTGEEQDGTYRVFVELERTESVPEQIVQVLDGFEHLTNCDQWSFRYYKEPSKEANVETLGANVPLDPDTYDMRMKNIENKVDVETFFDQGTVDVELKENNTIIFTKPYAGTLEAKLIRIGDYEKISQMTPGKISLDEASNSEMLFLNKFLGNYDIHKIENQFLIRKGNLAVVIEKERW